MNKTEIELLIQIRDLLQQLVNQGKPVVAAGPNPPGSEDSGGGPGEPLPPAGP